MYVVDVLAPVFVMIALGVVLRRSGFVSEALLAGMNRLAYWVALPCLLFYKVAEADFSVGTSGDAFVLVLAGMCACIGLSLVLAWVMGMEKRSIGAFIQAAYRGNLAFVGLAVILSAFGALPGTTDEIARQAERAAVVVLAPIVPIYNIAAVVVLLAFQHKLHAAALRNMLWKILTNPLLVACAAGLAVSLTRWSLPALARGSFDVPGRMALPLALLCVGGKLAGTRITGRLNTGLLAAIIKVGAAPAVGYLLARVIDAGPIETGVAMIFLACPTAIASYVLTEQLDGDGELAATAITLSTALSIASLAVAVAMIRL